MMLWPELIALGEMRTRTFRGMKKPTSDVELRIFEEYREFVLSGGDTPEHRFITLLQQQ